ncbi:acetoacetate decarboxylase family protein [Streptomyces sp. NPDC057011]|uniref:acetoacetate decarboxylase family protein n=1 Tax=unclassified Streptomyces TaxID=2593676 RepID=UPI003633862F
MLLIRYRGDLSYDEFALASLRFHGRRPGLWVHRIWVDDELSLRGGREIWGLPKKLAEFSWTSDTTVHISDRTGDIAALSFASRSRGLTLPLKMRGFGTLGDTLLLSTFSARGRIRPATLDILGWADTLPPLSRRSAAAAFHSPALRATVDAPLRLGPVPSSPLRHGG